MTFESTQESPSLMEVDGGCHCGRIKYRALANPATVVICHCTDCQVHSGSAFRTAVRVEHSDFQLLSGTPKIYVKVAANGNRRGLAFCPDCGTALYGCSADDPQSRYSLRVGTISQRHQLPARFHVWARSALPWLDDMPKLPAYPEQAPSVLPQSASMKEPR